MPGTLRRESLFAGTKGGVVRHLPARLRWLKDPRQEELLRHPFEHQVRATLKKESTIEFRLAEQDTPFCALLHQSLETVLYESRADALPLRIGQDRHRAKAEPALRAVRNRDRRKGDMADDPGIDFCDEGDRKGSALSKSVDDELFGVATVRMSEERRAGGATDFGEVGRSPGSNNGLKSHGICQAIWADSLRSLTINQKNNGHTTKFTAWTRISSVRVSTGAEPKARRTISAGRHG
jgi:hypothetical protein